MSHKGFPKLGQFVFPAEYELVKETPLGQGAFGTVYLARDKKTRGEVALKFFVRHKDWEIEHSNYQIVAGLCGSGIVCGHSGGPVQLKKGGLAGYYLAIDFVHGGMSGWDAVVSKEGQQMIRDASWKTLWVAFRQASHAVLSAANRANFVLRDIKLENMILNLKKPPTAGAKSTPRYVWLIDLGLGCDVAKAVEELGAGTPIYFSPELDEAIEDPYKAEETYEDPSAIYAFAVGNDAYALASTFASLAFVKLGLDQFRLDKVLGLPKKQYSFYVHGGEDQRVVETNFWHRQWRAATSLDRVKSNEKPFAKKLIDWLWFVLFPDFSNSVARQQARVDSLEAIAANLDPTLDVLLQIEAHVMRGVPVPFPPSYDELHSPSEFKPTLSMRALPRSPKSPRRKPASPKTPPTVKKTPSPKKRPASPKTPPTVKKTPSPKKRPASPKTPPTVKKTPSPRKRSASPKTPPTVKKTPSPRKSNVASPLKIAVRKPAEPAKKVWSPPRGNTRARSPPRSPKKVGRKSPKVIPFPISNQGRKQTPSPRRSAGLSNCPQRPNKNCPQTKEQMIDELIRLNGGKPSDFRDMKRAEIWQRYTKKV